MTAHSIHHHVRPDSTLLLNVMRELVNEEDFQERVRGSSPVLAKRLSAFTA